MAYRARIESVVILPPDVVVDGTSVWLKKLSSSSDLKPNSSLFRREDRSGSGKVHEIEVDCLGEKLERLEVRNLGYVGPGYSRP